MKKIHRLFLSIRYRETILKYRSTGNIHDTLYHYRKNEGHQFLRWCSVILRMWYSKHGRCFVYIENVAGNFLIAAPGLNDPNFDHTVILVCEHTREGAFGLVINKMLMNTITPLLQSFGIEKKGVDFPVHYGGPVNPEQGYVIYSPCDQKYDSIIIAENLAITASKDILYDIAAGTAPKHFIFALGFAGWAAQQLEEELMMGSWLVSPADFQIIFSVPVSSRWKAAAGLLGIDLERYCDLSGSA